MSAVWQKPAKTRQELKPYTGQLSRLTKEDAEFFATHYGIENPGRLIQRGEGRYVMPILGPMQELRGRVARTPWKDSPLSLEPHAKYPKAVTYLERIGPVQSFYVSAPVYPVVVLVEDQLSAMKLAEMGYTAVAMLGTPNSEHPDNYSGQDRVAEIAQFAAGRTVIVALDADMTAQSFLFARKWKDAFSSVRVAILNADIKDTSRDEIPAILGVSA